MNGLFWPRLRCGRRYSFIGLTIAGLVAGSPWTRAEDHSTTDPKAIAAGRQRFLMNCAHCHGADARGDEGPDLHGVTISDQRIAAFITNGIKGEMPKFGAKLSPDDVSALIAYLRSLE